MNVQQSFEKLTIKDETANIITLTPINNEKDTLSPLPPLENIKNEVIALSSSASSLTTVTATKPKKRIKPKLISTSIDSSNTTSTTFSTSTPTATTTNNPFNFNYDLSAPISSMFSAFFSKSTASTTTSTTPVSLTSTSTTATTSLISDKQSKKIKEKNKEIKEKRKRKERIRKKPELESSTNSNDEPSTTTVTTSTTTSNTFYDDADDDNEDNDEDEINKKSTPKKSSKSTLPSSKKKKKLKLSKALNMLEPFSFLISTSPNVHALFYLDLKDWLFSKDLNIDSNPFNSNYLLKLEQNGIDIKELVNIINDKELIESNKSKLIIVSDLYNLNLKNSSSTLLIDNNKFLKAQKELWWVKATNKMFMKPSVMKPSGHFKVWFGFLILELWYRFIWAYHTQSVYNQLWKDSGIEDTTMIDGDEENVNQIPDSLASAADEVIDLDDLGKGEDGEDDEEDDDEDEEEDDDDDEIIIYEGEYNAIKTNKISKEIVRNKNGASGDQNSSTSSSSSSDDDDDADDDDSDDSMDVEDDEKEHEVAIEEITTTNKLTSNQIKLDLIPTMVPIFFVHDTITESINEIESEFWDTGVWNIKKAIETFSQFIHSYYRDSKSLPSLTFAEIHENIHKFYNKRYKSFVNDLCIKTSDQDGFNWNWDTNSSISEDSIALPLTTSTAPLLSTSNRLLEYVAEVKVQQFNSLTQGGLVSHSHTFYYMFPFFADLKPPTYPITDYYMGLKRRLEKQGIFNKEVEKIVETLDRLLEERQLIQGTLKLNTSSSTTTDDSNNSLPSVLKAVDDYQNTRIKYLDELIITLKAEYHKLTNKVDQLPSTKKSIRSQNNNNTK